MVVTTENVALWIGSTLLICLIVPCCMYLVRMRRIEGVWRPVEELQTQAII
jgi:hypothetical protein